MFNKGDCVVLITQADYGVANDVYVGDEGVLVQKYDDVQVAIVRFTHANVAVFYEHLALAKKGPRVRKGFATFISKIENTIDNVT